jgi:hypothetical protein
MKQKPQKWVELEEELLREFKRGGIVEAPIFCRGSHVHGLCEGQQIVINPAPSVVDTLLHELLHRRYPRWGEKRVWDTATKLVYHMDSKEVRRWYRRYKRSKRTSQKLIRLED